MNSGNDDNGSAHVNASDREYVWDEAQIRAIARCCDMQQRVVPITGAAGTGKTTIVREVHNALREGSYSVVLCAPTGKAAKRITEATGIPAMTIHRLLEYPYPDERDPETGETLDSTVPKRDKKNPIPYRVVLADEYAMVNREIHANLIAALPAGGRICMFGDVNQLKPIEHGKLQGQETPFEAAIRRFNGVVLTTIHRTDEGSNITKNGMRILSGQVPLRTNDFGLIVTVRPVEALETHVMTALDNGVNYGTNQAQIIAPSKRSWVGTYKLNIMLQSLLNPLRPKDRVRMPRHRWDADNVITLGVGDKVIWTENSYDLRNPWERYYDEEMTQYIPTPPQKQIMNGETGIVLEIDEAEVIYIDLGDRVVEVPPSLSVRTKKGSMDIDPRKTIELAYCVTTHKSQGSEWEHVTYVMNKSTGFMQSRHNLYTGISRARKCATIITDQSSLQNAIRHKYTAMERQKIGNTSLVRGTR